MNTTKAVILTVIVALGLVAMATVSWAQFGNGNGQGKGRGQGQCNGGCAIEFTGAMDSAELIQPKLDAALDDEYHARAFYSAVLEQFGEVRPFSNIINAEQRHIDALIRLYEKYGLEAPADAYMDAEFEYADLAEAAQAGVDAEVANGALYDELFKDVTDPDVIRIFENLQWASEERHLPALERYLENGECNGGNCNGMGQGKGKGRGNSNGCGGGGCGGNGNGNGGGQGNGYRGGR